MNNDLAPNEEGIRPCLICGKPIRIVRVDEEKTICVEVEPKEWDAEPHVAIVKYDAHFPNCKDGN